MARPASLDHISITERVSYRIVALIRHPLFVVAYTAGTAYWWLSHPPTNGWLQAFHDDTYPWAMWTSLASLLALWIESSVGISQYYQAKRDALAAAKQSEMIRAMHAQSLAIAAALEHVLAAEGAQERHAQEVLGALRDLADRINEGASHCATLSGDSPQTCRALNCCRCQTSTEGTKPSMATHGNAASNGSSPRTIASRP